MVSLCSLQQARAMLVMSLLLICSLQTAVVAAFNAPCTTTNPATPRLAVLVISALLHTTLAQVPTPKISLPDTAAADRAKVKVLFENTYGIYRKIAFGHDDVKPLSESSTDPRNGWGATIIDSMSTMLVMGLDDLFDEAVRFVGTIDFNRSYTNDAVSVFESSIRYLGGLLSAYELSQKKHPILLQKARQLGDKLAFAWIRDNDIPFGYIDFFANAPSQTASNIAEAAGMLLEFNRLSNFTGNDTYFKLAQKSASHIARLPSPLPGLPAQGIDPATGQAVGGYVTFGGGSDAYFYSILRLAMLSPTPDTLLIDSWVTAVNSAIRILLRTSTVGEWTYIADYDDYKKIRHISSHIECFAGGDWVIGGKLLLNQTIIDYGLELVDACLNTYSSTATGLGPEAFAFLSSDGNYTGGLPPTADQMQFYMDNQHGFYITISDYLLRPEVLQSNLYAWRSTGDMKYYQAALRALQQIQQFAIVPANGGAAGLNDVNNAAAGGIDDTESFFFSGVLKYLYLTFDDPNKFNLDKYVLSYGGHLFAGSPHQYQ
ncbi:maturation of Asn-linked oligosaccharides protein [Mortierella sp. GBA30]|nr:maturation of Asn-linked oligosaccharides protein [Mortierella sp. GBA30]